MIGEEPKFSFFVACCFTLNYIVGSGFLTLPWAFHECGWLLGLLLLGTTAAMSIAAAWFILEAMETAELLATHGKGASIQSSPPAEEAVAISSRKTFNGATATYYESLSPVSSRALLPSENACDDSSIQPTNTLTHTLAAPHHDNALMLQLPSLTLIFLGRYGLYVYTISISIYMWGTLWAYACVFAGSLATELPLPLPLPLISVLGGLFSYGNYNAADANSAANHASVSASYIVYLSLFAAMMLPASLLELSEQVTVQVTLSMCRVLMLCAMLATIGYEYAFGGDAFGLSTPATGAALSTWHPTKTYILLPIAAYSFIMHHSIPSLSQPVRDKSQLRAIFTVTLLVCFCAYALVGVSMSLFFGQQTLMASNLNWKGYVGANFDVGLGVPFYARVISYFIVIFPALDVASAFPLNAITLGNNLMSFFYGAGEQRAYDSLSGQPSYNKNAFRLLAAAPPLIFVALQSNLSVITDYTGLTGFVIAFIFPALLAVFARRRLVEAGVSVGLSDGGSVDTYTGIRLQLAVLLAGVFLLAFVGYSLVFYGPPASSRR